MLIPALFVFLPIASRDEFLLLLTLPSRPLPEFDPTSLMQFNTARHIKEITIAPPEDRLREPEWDVR